MYAHDRSRHDRPRAGPCSDSMSDHVSRPDDRTSAAQRPANTPMQAAPAPPRNGPAVAGWGCDVAAAATAAATIPQLLCGCGPPAGFEPALPFGRPQWASDGRWRCEIGREGCYGRREGTWRVPPQLRACHEAQATGSRLPRLSKRKMKVTHQLASPSRSEVAQPHGRRCHLQRSKVKSAVVHETKRGLDASPVDATPECDGRMCNAVQCTQQASGDGNGSQPC
jgi:hypothetical protein